MQHLKNWTYLFFLTVFQLDLSEAITWCIGYIYAACFKQIKIVHLNRWLASHSLSVLLGSLLGQPVKSGKTTSLGFWNDLLMRFFWMVFLLATCSLPVFLLFVCQFLSGMLKFQAMNSIISRLKPAFVLLILWSSPNGQRHLDYPHRQAFSSQKKLHNED